MQKLWAKSVNGPDWLDIRKMMRELGEAHKCIIYLEVTPAGTREGPQVRWVATACSNSPGSDLHQCEESIAVCWPNVANKSVEGTVFRLLYQLDHVLTAKWWVQGEYHLP